MTKKDLRNFSFIWSIIFIIIGVYPLFSGNEIRIWSLIIALLFIIIGLLRPNLLNKFYCYWMIFGEYMGNIISKIILFILYFTVFSFVSFILKIIGKDLLNKKISKSEKSYWITRDTQPQSMKNQF